MVADRVTGNFHEQVAYKLELELADNAAEQGVLPDARLTAGPSTRRTRDTAAASVCQGSVEAPHSMDDEADRTPATEMAVMPLTIRIPSLRDRRRWLTNTAASTERVSPIVRLSDVTHTNESALKGYRSPSLFTVLLNSESGLPPSSASPPTDTQHSSSYPVYDSGVGRGTIPYPQSRKTVSERRTTIENGHGDASSGSQVPGADGPPHQLTNTSQVGNNASINMIQQFYVVKGYCMPLYPAVEGSPVPLKDVQALLSLATPPKLTTPEEIPVCRMPVYTLDGLRAASTTTLSFSPMVLPRDAPSFNARATQSSCASPGRNTQATQSNLTSPAHSDLARQKRVLDEDHEDDGGSPSKKRRTTYKQMHAKVEEEIQQARLQRATRKR